MKYMGGTIRRIVFVSTYPPQRCGIATFTQDLLKNMRGLLPDVELEVCAVNRRGISVKSYPTDVIAQIDQDDRHSYIEAARYINKRAAETLVIVQHEYGIYGGKAGDYILDLVHNLKCPIITTLHTVIDDPSPQMRKVARGIISSSKKVVVLTHDSYRVLTKLYPTLSSKVARIDHGIHPIIFQQPSEAKFPIGLSGRTVLLTFGLLSRNKGIEYVINALPAIVAKFPDTIYLVVGRTHPSVLLDEGESYRQELVDLVKKNRMEKNIKFIDDYLPLDKILAYLQAADIYIASSLDPKQSVSGTLSYALGAGCAVVTTDFSQAKELVTENVGRIVPGEDSRAISLAVNSLLKNPKKLRSMSQIAYESTRSMLWSNVADNYIELLDHVLEDSKQKLKYWPDFSLKHLESMTNKLGLVQFARKAQPMLRSGYTLDDNSRALQLVVAAADARPELANKCNALAKIYINVMAHCLNQEPIVNYLSGASRAITEQNDQEDLRDSFARAYYALQTTAAGSLGIASEAKLLIDRLPTIPDNQILRPISLYLLGACDSLEAGNKEAKSLVNKLAKTLIEAYETHSSAGWRWFEPSMTYANGQLCASLLRAAQLTNSRKYKKNGLESLTFLCQVAFMGEVYVPIGQDGWYSHSKHRALFDQQPEDVWATIRALKLAFELTKDQSYVRLAKKAFSWFLGNNLLGYRMYDDESGGCHDGLTLLGPNKNEGVESTVTYLQARLALENLV